MGNVYTKSGALAKRIYFGATLIWEKVIELYDLFKQRVLSDGGTFIENPIVFNNELLLLTSNAFKPGKLYSALPEDGTGDFTVDRNSTATYVGQDGLIKTALANVPRIDWSTGEAVLLLEPQMTNLVAYSEDFSNNAIWVRVGVGITSNLITSPDGNISATKMSPYEQSGTHFVLMNINNTVSHTVSSFFKSSEYDQAFLRFNDDNTNQAAIFDLTSGTITRYYGSRTIGKMTDYGGGWYRCELYIENPINLLNCQFGVADNNDVIVSGDTISGIYMWGAQLEQGTEASSYIPTNGTTVTRLADNISVPTPAGVTSITETIDGVDQTPITTIPTTYSLPVGNINKVKMI